MRISWLEASLSLGLVFCAVAARPAQAQQSPDALINRGIELRIAGDDEAALREFEKAVALARTPKAVAQVGLAEMALGRWEAADAHLTEALRAANDSWIVRNRKTLDDAMNSIKRHVARVEVVAEPAGAEIIINGKSVGKAPLDGAVRVSAGEVSVEATFPGYKSTTHRVNVVGGQYQNVVLRLEKLPPTIPPPPPPPAPEEAPSRLRPILKWTALGLGGAGVITGVAATFIHKSKVDEFDKAANMGCAEKDGTAVHKSDGTRAPECQGALDAYRNARTAQIVGFAAGGVLLTTWLVLALTEPESRPEPSTSRSRTSRWACAPALGVTQVSCAVVF